MEGGSVARLYTSCLLSRRTPDGGRRGMAQHACSIHHHHHRRRTDKGTADAGQSTAVVSTFPSLLLHAVQQAVAQDT